MGAPRRRGEVTRPGDGCKKVVGVSYRARAHGRGAWGWFGREVAWIPDVPARAVVRLALGFRDHASLRLDLRGCGRSPYEAGPMNSPTGIGAPVRRKEDRPHLTGAARFTADLRR